MGSLLVLGVGVGTILISTGARPVTLVLVAMILLVPGRIQGYYWRDFFRGRRLLGQGEAKEAISYFARFLDQLAARPWLKKLIWLSWGMYTRDIEAMTRTNLGVAHMYLGDVRTAEQHLRAAMQLDVESPLPWYNLGIINTVRGDGDTAAEAFKRARRFGYSGNVSDQIVRTIGEALARFEGRGIRDVTKEA